MYKTLVSVLFGLVISAKACAERPKARARSGTYVGKYSAKVFLGIPYAKPPTGNLRWQPPQELPPRDDIYYAEDFGKNPLQNSSRVYNVSEDCLYLNIRTPGLDDKRRPVCVFIHGGGFSLYSGSMDLWQGNSFAEDDIVFVTINYRLGAAGFLYLEELDSSCKQTGYLGLLDQIAALEWVRKNIAAFGGNPDNVTIMGESAGAASVCLLMCMPEAKGLFHKAIAESGSTNLRHTRADATAIARQFLAVAGVENVAELRKFSTEELLQTQIKAMKKFGWTAPEAMFAPVADGVNLPDNPLQCIRNGAARDIPLLCGTNRDEYYILKKSFIASFINFTIYRWFTPSVIKALTSRLDDAASRFYGTLYPGLKRTERFRKAATDAIFMTPAANFCEAQSANAPVYFYRFDWQSVIGAFHGLELCFVFNDVDICKYDKKLGKSIPQSLRNTIHRAWVNFIKTGSPAQGKTSEWEPYNTTTRLTLILDNKIQLRNDPDKIKREYWQARDVHDGELYNN